MSKLREEILKIVDDVDITPLNQVVMIEKISDEHAIGFAEWLSENYIVSAFGFKQKYSSHYLKVSELLTIYKQQIK